MGIAYVNGGRSVERTNGQVTCCVYVQTQISFTGSMLMNVAAAPTQPKLPLASGNVKDAPSSDFGLEVILKPHKPKLPPNKLTRSVGCTPIFSSWFSRIISYVRSCRIRLPSLSIVLLREEKQTPNFIKSLVVLKSPPDPQCACAISPSG